MARLAERGRIGYVQSDEISLVWLFDAPDSEPLFGGKVHKLTSVLASLAAAAFQRQLYVHWPILDAATLANRLPHFDARVFSLPSKTEAANAFLWRAMDARKNAVSMAARSRFSAKQLHGKDRSAMRSMLSEAGLEFDTAYPVNFRLGTWLRQVSFERSFTADELARIPEKHRPAPDSLVTRSEVREIDMPEFNLVANREAVIFDGQQPIIRDAT